jgi:hypothetical protein
MEVETAEVLVDGLRWPDLQMEVVRYHSPTEGQAGA